MMVKATLSTLPCLVMVVAIALQATHAMKELIRFDPQIHKPGQSNDADFTKNFASSDDDDQLRLDSDSEEGPLAFLEQLERYQKADPREDAVYYEEDGDLQSNYDAPPERSYLQSIFGRIGDEDGNEEDFEMSDVIQNVKAPKASALTASNDQVAIAANDGAASINMVMLATLTCLAIAAALGVIVSVFCFVKIQRRSRSTQRFDYSGPGNGSSNVDSLSSNAKAAAASKFSAIFGGSNPSNMDKKLANNATLYHFEHHKKEMMAAESTDVPQDFGDSDNDSGDDEDEENYTVYECPGLAPTGEMQVDNPLFKIKQQTSQPSSSTHSSPRRSGSPDAGSPQ